MYIRRENHLIEQWKIQKDVWHVYVMIGMVVNVKAKQKKVTYVVVT